MFRNFWLFSWWFPYIFLSNFWNCTVFAFFEFPCDLELHVFCCWFHHLFRWMPQFFYVKYLCKFLFLILQQHWFSLGFCFQFSFDFPFEFLLPWGNLHCHFLKLFDQIQIAGADIEPDQHMLEYLHCRALNLSFLGWSVLQSLDLPAFHLLAWPLHLS